MIDLHFHCLPGIDDGPRTWDEAVALCRAAADEGVETIVATPHVLREPWINDDPKVLDRLVFELNTRLGGHPRILAGCEVLFCSDLVELWERRGPLTGINRGPHVLVEFPATSVPRSAEAVVHEMSMLGATFVIAHPERNLVFASDPTRLERLVQLGAMTQVTAASLLGEFGRAFEQSACEFMERDLVHAVASDAHSTTARPPRLAAARQLVRARWGAEVEERLFVANPAAIAAISVEVGSAARAVR
jgi:protein-tyrosine phosphatase